MVVEVDDAILLIDGDGLELGLWWEADADSDSVETEAGLLLLWQICFLPQKVKKSLDEPKYGIQVLKTASRMTSHT